MPYSYWQQCLNINIKMPHQLDYWNNLKASANWRHINPFWFGEYRINSGCRCLGGSWVYPDQRDFKNQKHNYFFNKLPYSILVSKLCSLEGQKSSGSWLKNTIPWVVRTDLPMAGGSVRFFSVLQTVNQKKDYFLVKTTVPQHGIPSNESEDICHWVGKILRQLFAVPLRTKSTHMKIS